jgi:hypothetical protein
MLTALVYQTQVICYALLTMPGPSARSAYSWKLVHPSSTEGPHPLFPLSLITWCCTLKAEQD